MKRAAQSILWVSIVASAAMGATIANAAAPPTDPDAPPARGAYHKKKTQQPAPAPDATTNTSATDTTTTPTDPDADPGSVVVPMPVYVNTWNDYVKAYQVYVGNLSRAAAANETVKEAATLKAQRDDLATKRKALEAKVAADQDAQKTRQSQINDLLAQQQKVQDQYTAALQNSSDSDPDAVAKLKAQASALQGQVDALASQNRSTKGERVAFQKDVDGKKALAATMRQQIVDTDMRALDIMSGTADPDENVAKLMTADLAFQQAQQGAAATLDAVDKNNDMATFGMTEAKLFDAKQDQLKAMVEAYRARIENKLLGKAIQQMIDRSIAPNDNFCGAVAKCNLNPGIHDPSAPPAAPGGGGISSTRDKSVPAASSDGAGGSSGDRARGSAIQATDLQHETF